MASFDKQLHDFVAKFGEEAVPTALTAYVTARERSKAYAEKHKGDRAKYNAILSAAADPAIAAKLASLGIKI